MINLSKLLNVKYLHLENLLAQDFLRIPYEGPIDLSRWLIPDTYQLVFINGYLNVALTTCPPALFQIHETECVLTISESMLQPLHVLNLHYPTPEMVLQPLHMNIQLATNVEFTLFEEHVSVVDECYLTEWTIEVQLGKGAHFNYYKLQCESAQAYHVSTTTVLQQADSAWHYVAISDGAKISIDDVSVEHNEKGSFATLHGLFEAKQDQQVMQRTRVHHFSGGCATQQHYRGIAMDQAKSIFDGRMIVHADAVKSSVKQSNHNLLLSDTAEIDTQPTLEIYTDDVIASHGATVGQLDEALLFYCQSRGISRLEAQRLLISGFRNVLFDELPENAILKSMKQAISED